MQLIGKITTCIFLKKVVARANASKVQEDKSVALSIPINSSVSSLP